MLQFVKKKSNKSLQGITLTHGCLKVNRGVPILLCIFVDPLYPRINCLVLRECLTHFTEIVYLKQRQEDMLSLVFKKLTLCPVMPASRGVNPLATSHTADYIV